MKDQTRVIAALLIGVAAGAAQFKNTHDGIFVGTKGIKRFRISKF